MTLTHNAQIYPKLPGHTLFTAFATMPLALIIRVRQRHLDAIQARTPAKLPIRLKHDIGEIDHIPPPPPTFMQSEPSSYQDRLQQMWLR
jgi:hypothetical protein